MIELLVVVIVVLAYGLGRTQDERDRLRLRLSELWTGSWSPRAHWQPVEQRLAAERAIWRQTAAVQQAARQAMREVVAAAATVAEREGAAAGDMGGSGPRATGTAQEVPAVPEPSATPNEAGVRGEVEPKAAPPAESPRRASHEPLP